MSLKINIVQGKIRKDDDDDGNVYHGMEAVHHPDERPWIGEKIKLKDYFAQFSLLNSASKCPGFTNIFQKTPAKKIREMMEGSEKGVIGDDMFKEIVENCDAENFSIPREMEPQQQFTEVKGKYQRFVPTDIPSSGTKTLQTLSLQQEYLDKVSEYEKYKRMRGLRNPNNAHFEAAPAPSVRLNLDLMEEEILVAVRVYRPVKTQTKNVAASMSTVHRFVQEIYMLGSNTLNQLRDLIKCPGDYMVAEASPDDVQTFVKHESRHPSSTAFNKTAKERYKSAFFFIEDCFYNDTRWPDCHDLSEVIREWASSRKRKIGPFKTAIMESTQIKDLTLRLGYPYVYVHQGDHEHLISFVDARLLCADDVQKASSYPFERSSGMVHSKMCMVCNTFIAKWITVNNERVPEDPFFFCNDCFRQFNFSPKNEKIGNFTAYPYIDVNAL